MARAWVLAALLFFSAPPLSVASTTTPKRTIPPPVYTPQEVLLLFAGQKPDDRILVSLNNNRNGSLTTTMAVYLVDGTVAPLPDVSMSAGESKLIDLGPILASAGVDRGALGWLKLDYTGLNMEMGAQLTLYPASDGAGVDSPRSLMTDFKSRHRDAVFWMPAGGEAHIGLTNNSPDPISVRLSCGLAASQFTILPRQTVVKDVPAGDLGTSPLFSPTAASCDAESDGAVDALRAAGVVRGPNGYGAPVRFYDPAAATLSSLTAPGVQTDTVTHITVHNLTELPVIITPTLREATVQTPKEVGLPGVLLAPHASEELAVNALFSKMLSEGVQRATFTLETSAPLGAIVGALTQIGNKDGLIEDVPLRTANPPAYARGAYPLRWDQDYTNLVTVTNTADTSRSLRGFITAGSVIYLLEKVSLDPGASVVFDVDQLRSQQTPDEAGHKIPLDATSGRFHWFDMSMGKQLGLMGRQSLSSQVNVRRSSFSCGEGCAQNYIDSPVFITYPWPVYGSDLITEVAYGATDTSNYVAQEYNYGSWSFYYLLNYSDYASSFSTSSEGIVGFGPSYLNSGGIYFSGLNPGTTEFDWTDYFQQFQLDVDGYDCDESDNVSPSGGQIQVPPSISYSGLKDLALGSGTGAITSNAVTATGSPGGGTYSWTASNSNITLSNTASATVTTTAASTGSSVLTVTYTVNGVSQSATGTINVFQPSSVAIVSDSGVTATNTCFSGTNQYNGPARSVTYQIQANQGGTTVPVTADVSLSETFTVLSSPPPSCGSTPTATQGLVSHQTFTDNFNYCSTSCLPVQNSVPQGSCTLKLEHVWTANGFSIFDHTLTYTCTNITPQ